jgi:hypothetical protein
MADGAARLVDEVLAEVPVRQWVCSLPWRLRYAMGYDRKLCADVLDAFIVSLCRSLRRRAKSRLDLGSVEDALFGAVTFIQRADSSLRLNVHFHCLVLDGVYVRDDKGELRFHELGAPTNEEIHDVARWSHERLGRVLERQGRSLDDGTADLLAREQPVPASCTGLDRGPAVGRCTASSSMPPNPRSPAPAATDITHVTLRCTPVGSLMRRVTASACSIPTTEQTACLVCLA